MQNDDVPVVEGRFTWNDPPPAAAEPPDEGDYDCVVEEIHIDELPDSEAKTKAIEYLREMDRLQGEIKRLRALAAGKDNNDATH